MKCMLLRPKGQDGSGPNRSKTESGVSRGDKPKSQLVHFFTLFSLRKRSKLSSLTETFLAAVEVWCPDVAAIFQPDFHAPPMIPTCTVQCCAPPWWQPMFPVRRARPWNCPRRRQSNGVKIGIGATPGTGEDLAIYTYVFECVKRGRDDGSGPQCNVRLAPS